MKEELELEDDSDRVQTEAGGGGDGRRSVEAGPQHQPRPGLRQDGQTRPQVGGGYIAKLNAKHRQTSLTCLSLSPDILLLSG